MALAIPKMAREIPKMARVIPKMARGISKMTRKYVKRLREHLGNTWEIRTQTYLGNIRKYLCPLGNTQIDLENNWKYLGNTEIRQRFPSLFFANTACQTVSKCLKWIERFGQFFRLAKPNEAH